MTDSPDHGPADRAERSNQEPGGPGISAQFTWGLLAVIGPIVRTTHIVFH